MLRESRSIGSERDASSELVLESSMPASNAEREIRVLTDQFVSDLTALIRKAALESVQEALGGAGMPRAPRAAAPSPAAPRPAPKPKRGGGARRHKRSAEEIFAQMGKIMAYIDTHPGQSISEITQGIGFDGTEIKLPLSRLVEDGQVKTEGQKRGMRYHPIS